MERGGQQGRVNDSDDYLNPVVQGMAWASNKRKKGGADGSVVWKWLWGISRSGRRRALCRIGLLWSYHCQVLSHVSVEVKR